MSVQKALSLKAQQLSALPAFVAELTELEVLDADQNVLTELPAWIGQLTHLKSLSVYSNHLLS